MNPITVYNDLKDTYKRYIVTRYPLGKTDKYLRDKFYALFNNHHAEEILFKGPILEVTPPYKSGNSLNDLGDYWKPLANHLTKNGKGNLAERKLYLHQEKALKASEKGNFIVATGTGSGKTESFLFPIINYCLKNRSKGVQALLIYPLNALIEDQIDRLRTLLSGSDVTFGKYTGQTPNTFNEAGEEEKGWHKGCKNLLIDRQTMRKTPPNILITNYTMLEYMLLRPWDDKIICNCDSSSYKFIVLDEAHSYNGTQGAEVAYLLRRLRSRLNKRADEICYIATSATLGGGDDSVLKTLKFASNLFGSEFKDGTLVKGEKHEANKHLPEASSRIFEFEEVLKWEEPNLTDMQTVIANNFKIKSETTSEINDDLSYQIYDKLKHCSWIRAIVQFLESNKATPVKEIALEVFKDVEADLLDKEQALINLVSWADFARDKISKLALIPARYHLFISATKGVYAELADIPEKIASLALSQSAIRDKQKYPFEVGTCRICGEAYITGIIVLNEEKCKYKPVSDSFFESMDLKEMNAEKVIYGFKKTDKGETVKICTICGMLNDTCGHNASIELYPKGGFKTFDLENEKEPEDSQNSNDNPNEQSDEESDKESKTNSCKCGADLKKSLLVLRLSENGTTSPLVSTIFNHAPEMDCNEIEKISADFSEYDSPIMSKGRKLIIFSDSRQKAAYFGPYMQVTHNQLLLNKFLIKEITKLDEPAKIKFFIEDTKSVLRKTKSRALLLNSLRPKDNLKDEIIENQNIIRQRVTQGLTWLIDRTGLSRAGLEGLGIAAIGFSDKSIANKIEVADLSLSATAKFALVQVVLQYLRYSGLFLTSFEEDKVNTNQEDAYFDFVPNKFFKNDHEKNSGKNEKIISIIGKFKPNKFQDFIKAALEKLTDKPISEEIAEKIIGIIFTALINRNTEIVRNDKGFYQLDIEKLSLFPVANNKFKEPVPGGYHGFRVCTKCGRLSWINLNGLCNFIGCGGLVEENNTAFQLDHEYNHYRNIYLESKFFNDLRAVEHTAQLDKMTAAKDYQREFKLGRLNILSCSTTFEMGVDLGDLSLVFMRNMPPGAANYVQRAGRAGRRPGISPLVITYCRNLPHDQYFFKEYKTMVNGEVQPPIITLTNEKILFRHLNAVLFADFLRQNKDFFEERVERQRDLQLKHFFENENGSFFNGLTPAENFGTTWLEKNKQPKQLLQIFGSNDKTEADFVSDKIEKYFKDSFLCDNDRYGLAKKLKNYTDEKKFYEDRKMELLSKFIIKTDTNTGNQIKSFDSLIKKMQNDQLISFLSSRGILPSYAFPNAVVPLKIIDLADGADAVDLTRNLDQAISEYAPSASVVANSMIYTSGALAKFSTQKLTEYSYFKCPDCSFFVCSKNNIDGEELQNQIDKHQTNCNAEKKENQYPKMALLPEWGFAVPKGNKGKHIKSSTRLAKNGFASELCIDERAFKANNFKNISMSNCKIQLSYADGYEIYRVNAGKANKDKELSGFKICKSCGMSVVDKKDKHKTPHGYDCTDNFKPKGYSLISVADTDVLKVRFTDFTVSNLSFEDISSFWLTILYAFIEAASRKLNIPRNELDGIYRLESDNQVVELFIIDSVPGGAGHVNRIFADESGIVLISIISQSVKILKCKDCAEDTACYSCLFHQSNQKTQHKLNRGLALKWLESIC